MNPQTQAGRTFAVRDGLVPNALFQWDDLQNDWVIWMGTVGINAASSNLALESGGNLDAIHTLLTSMNVAVTNVAGGTSFMPLLVAMLQQLQFIAVALNAPIITIPDSALATLDS